MLSFLGPGRHTSVRGFRHALRKTLRSLEHESMRCSFRRPGRNALQLFASCLSKDARCRLARVRFHGQTTDLEVLLSK